MFTNEKQVKIRERITSQKKIILDYLKKTRNHPSAKTVYSAVREKLPRISMGTVYRILNDLKKRGEIQEIPQEVARYDGDVSSHIHFICENCDNIFDIYDKCEFLKRKKIKVGKIKKYQVYFYGNCKNCQE